MGIALIGHPWLYPTPTDFKTAVTVNKGHGRLERRTPTSSAMLKDYLDWPYLEQVFKLERRFINLQTGEVTSEIHYGLTSLAPAEAGSELLLVCSAPTGALKMACIIAGMSPSRRTGAA
jgi:hypothetical protein